MPSSTFNSAANDQHVQLSAVSYPPAGTPSHVDGVSEIQVSRQSNGPYYVENGLIRFDTSALPDGATITAATLRLRVTGHTETDALSLTAGWYTWDGTSASDWTNTPETNALGATLLSGLTLNVYNDFTLTNLSNISKTGYTYLRLHISQRASDAAPTGINYMKFNSQESGNAAQLVVTYDAGGDLVGMVAI